MKHTKNIFIVLAILLAIISASVVLLARNNDSPNKNKGSLSRTCGEAAPSYVGLTEAQATDNAIQAKLASRVVSRDGVGGLITEDYSLDRLNFDINNGKVTKATCY